MKAHFHNTLFDLASQVDYVDKRLQDNLSNQVITQVCDHLSAFYIHDIILMSQFNAQGAEQLKIDFEKGIRAIFSQHVLDQSKLESYSQLNDVIHLLIMKQANAILLLETLSDAKQQSNYPEILKEVGITHLKGEQAVKILNKRVDLK